jgi:hypothetical protein
MLSSGWGQHISETYRVPANMALDLFPAVESSSSGTAVRCVYTQARVCVAPCHSVTVVLSVHHEVSDSILQPPPLFLVLLANKQKTMLCSYLAHGLETPCG